MDRILSVEEAVSRIEPGSLVAIGGILTYRRPMALIFEIVRQSIQQLTVMGWTLGIETEVLLSQPNIVSAIRTSYTGLDVFGIGPAYRNAVEAGRVRVIEETETTLGFGLRAALQGVDYMPARSLIGTDLLRVRSDIRTVRSPYTENVYPAVPKIVPDVALIHVPLADDQGNAVIETNYGVDAEIALLARYTIISAEEVVPAGDTRLLGRTRVLGKSVNAVVRCSNGAWPTSCYPNYPIDALAITDYIEAWMEGEEVVRRLLEDWQRKVSTC